MVRLLLRSPSSAAATSSRRAVRMSAGDSTETTVNCVLTLIAYLPGLIHSLVVTFTCVYRLLVRRRAFSL
jgi:hypothetical protein